MCLKLSWSLRVDHCMVNFVRPHLLGTRVEFMNRFSNPITNGQHLDSTSADVQLMKRRAHVLHQMLTGCIHVSARATVFALATHSYIFIWLVLSAVFYMIATTHQSIHWAVNPVVSWSVDWPIYWLVDKSVGQWIHGLMVLLSNGSFDALGDRATGQSFNPLVSQMINAWVYCVYAFRGVIIQHSSSSFHQSMSLS